MEMDQRIVKVVSLVDFWKEKLVELNAQETNSEILKITNAITVMILVPHVSDHPILNVMVVSYGDIYMVILVINPVLPVPIAHS